MTIAQPDTFAMEPAIQGRSLWSDAWRRLRRNKATMASVVILSIIAIACVVGPMLLPHPYDEVYWDAISIGPDSEAGFYFGTDENGRDLLVRTLHGGRV